MARDHYNSASERLTDARTAKAMEAMKLGRSLELIDAAPPPFASMENREMMLFTGLVGGLLTGLIVHLIQSLLAARSMRGEQLNRAI